MTGGFITITGCLAQVVLDIMPPRNSIVTGKIGGAFRLRFYIGYIRPGGSGSSSSGEFIALALGDGYQKWSVYETYLLVLVLELPRENEYRIAGFAVFRFLGDGTRWNFRDSIQPREVSLY